MSWVCVPRDPSLDIARKATARELYKHQQHKIRWERRYGGTMKVFTGEIGTIEGFRIVRAA